MASTQSPEGAEHLVARETSLAIRNGLKLGLSLFSTMGVAVVVRFWVPRHLGAEAYGQLSFAESFAAMCFAFTILGLHTYMNRAVATRIEHASEFFGGMILVRLAASLIICIVMAVCLWAMGKSPQTWQLVYLFAVGQFLYIFNQSLAALLQSAGTVNEFAIINVVGKLVWGAGIVVALLFGGGIIVVAWAFTLTELFKTPALFIAARKHLKLRLDFSLKSGLTVIGASFGFFINELAMDFYARIDVTMISWLITDAEVGYYQASININFLVLLLLPLIHAIFMPMAARIGAQSKQTLNDTMEGAIRIVLALVIPMALLVIIHADALMPLAFGKAFAPSARSLRVLAVMFPLTYVNVIFAVHLFVIDRTWTVTRTSLMGMVINPALNWFVIPWAYGLFPDGGGAGLGAAMTSLATELGVVTILYLALRRDGTHYSKRLSRSLVKLVFVCALVAAAHQGLILLLPDVGLWLLIIEGLLYVILAWPMGALPINEIRMRVMTALRERRQQSNEPLEKTS
ncbi:MAG: flippase [Myxococcota bacterium]